MIMPKLGLMATLTRATGSLVASRAAMPVLSGGVFGALSGLPGVYFLNPFYWMISPFRTFGTQLGLARGAIDFAAFLLAYSSPGVLFGFAIWLSLRSRKIATASWVKSLLVGIISWFFTITLWIALLKGDSPGWDDPNFGAFSKAALLAIASLAGAVGALSAAALLSVLYSEFRTLKFLLLTTATGGICGLVTPTDLGRLSYDFDIGWALRFIVSYISFLIIADFFAYQAQTGQDGPKRSRWEVPSAGQVNFSASRVSDLAFWLALTIGISSFPLFLAEAFGQLFRMPSTAFVHFFFLTRISIAALAFGLISVFLRKDLLRGAALSPLLLLPLATDGAEVSLGNTLHFSLLITEIFALYYYLAYSKLTPVLITLPLVTILSIAWLDKAFPMHTALLFALSMVAARVAVEFVRHNREELALLWRASFFTLLGRVARYWWLLAVIGVAAFFLNKYVVQSTSDYLYDNGILLDGGPATARNLELDIKNKVRIEFEEKRKRVNLASHTASRAAGNSIEAFTPAAMAAFNEILPDAAQIPEFNKRCSGSWIKCCIENRIRRGIRDAYSSIRERQLARYKYLVSELVRNAQAGKNFGDESLVPALNESLDSAERYTLDSIQAFFHGLDLIQLGLLALLIIAIVKSFAIVTMRVAFSSKIFERITFYSESDRVGHATPYGPPNVMDREQSFQLSGSKHGVFYPRRSTRKRDNFNVSGVAEKWTLPHKAKAVFSRIRNGRYSLDHAEPGVALLFSAGSGKRFVSWSLQEGEEVVVNLANLAAIEASVDLRTRLSLKLTTIPFGRLFYTVAKGPGTIVLISEGQPARGPNHEEFLGGYDLDGFVAWSLESNFSLVQGMSFADIYINGVRAKLEYGSAVVDSVGSQAGGTASRFNIGRFVSTFACPW